MENDTQKNNYPKNRKPARKFEKEFVSSVVADHLDKKVRVEELSNKYNIHQAVIYNWVRKEKDRRRKSLRHSNHYDKKFINETVQKVVKNKWKVSEAARRLNLNPKTLNKWMNAAGYRAADYRNASKTSYKPVSRYEDFMSGLIGQIMKAMQ